MSQVTQMEVMISADEIRERIYELAAQINQDYQKNKKELVLIGLLRGSIIFTSDLTI